MAVAVARPRVNRMKTTAFFFPVFLLLYLPAGAQTPVKPAVPDKLTRAESARLNGYIGSALDASSKNRILAQDVNRLIEPFQNRTETWCWQSEFWGKWFTSAVLAYQYRPEPALKAKLDSAVTALLATQTDNGYIGNYADNRHLKGWDIWGRKYCTLGLLAYYDLTNDQKSLLAARREADFLMAELDQKDTLIVQQGFHRGMAATSVLEPITLLYARTGDTRYLNFAERIVQEWESPAGPQLIAKANTDVAHRFPKPKNWFGYEQGQKAYEMMSCYEGLLELYRITGKPAYRQAVESAWENIRQTEINVAGSGSALECWFGGKALQTQPVYRFQETCVTVTWIKLSQQLLRLTGEPKYADAIEESFYNALLGSMRPDGATWAKYTPLTGTRQTGEDQCGMETNCCIASGPRGLFTWPLTNVMHTGDGLNVNFYTGGTYQLNTPRGQVASVTQQTNYPETGKITLRVVLPKPEEFTLRLRIPAWSGQTTLTVNNETRSVKPGQYAEIKRTWLPSDVVSLTLDMRGRVVRLGDLPANVAIVRGPVLLARDSRLGGPAVDEITTPVVDKDGYFPLEPATPQAGIWMSFTAPFVVGVSREEEYAKPVRLLLCDYASAGNTFAEDSRYRTWMPQLIDPQQLGAK